MKAKHQGLTSDSTPVSRWECLGGCRCDVLGLPVMRLLLIRHGQTLANVLGQLNTRKPGPGLTAIGEKQAAAVPGALQDEQVGAVFASTLIRTQITARPLSEELGVPVTVLDSLREIEAGDLEDLTDAPSV